MKQLNIGIDIGATKIVIAGCFDIESKPSVILDAEENRMTTSCLAFMKNQRLLAFAAETQATAYPEGVIFGRGKFECQIFWREFKLFLLFIRCKTCFGGRQSTNN